MNQLRKIAGIIWMLLGPAAICFMIAQAALKISAATHKMQTAATDVARASAAAAKMNVQLQWGIIIGIFLPVAIGLVIFGYYAWKGEYNRQA